ncbi:response regulator transcription factor [Leucobacter iarius]|uniref:Response regulator transcription factor n=1 Tax=Leucobacter iarius TaxID=333963 RepID=A0ABN2LMY9_9MICO
MIRIVLADDEELIRGALSALLDLEEDLRVVAEAANGSDAVAAAVAHDPDVVLLDLEMPGLDGIGAAKEILRQTRASVVIVTRHARPGALKRALEVGVRGFVPKSTPAANLARIIRSVAGGERYIDSALAATALSEPGSPLTSREADVLRLVRDGRSTREISKLLHLASGTVRNVASVAIAKLHAESRHAAAKIAADRGWI